MDIIWVSVVCAIIMGAGLLWCYFKKQVWACWMISLGYVVGLPLVISFLRKTTLDETYTNIITILCVIIFVVLVLIMKKINVK